MKRGITKRPSSAQTATGTAKLKRSRADRAVAAKFMSLLKSGGDARFKKIKRIRQSVRTSSYENEVEAVGCTGPADSRTIRIILRTAIRRAVEYAFALDS